MHEKGCTECDCDSFARAGPRTCECEHREAEHAPCSLSKDDLLRAPPHLIPSGRCIDCGLGVGRHAGAAPPDGAIPPEPAEPSSTADAVPQPVAAPEPVFLPKDDLLQCGHDESMPLQHLKKHKRRFQYEPVAEAVRLYEAREYLWRHLPMDVYEHVDTPGKKLPCMHPPLHCTPYVKRFSCHGATDAVLHSVARRRKPLVDEYRSAVGSARCGVTYRFIGCIELTAEVKAIQDRTQSIRRNRKRHYSETVAHHTNLPPHYIDRFAVGCLYAAVDPSTGQPFLHVGATAPGQAGRCSVFSRCFPRTALSPCQQNLLVDAALQGRTTVWMMRQSSDPKYAEVKALLCSNTEARDEAKHVYKRVSSFNAVRYCSWVEFVDLVSSLKERVDLVVSATIGDLTKLSPLVIAVASRSRAAGWVSHCAQHGIHQTLCVDVTHCENYQQLMLIPIVGLLASAKGMPIGFALVSHQFTKVMMRILSFFKSQLNLQPDYVMSDAHRPTYNAVVNVWPQARFLVRFIHVLRHVKKRLRGFAPEARHFILRSLWLQRYSQTHSRRMYYQRDLELRLKGSPKLLAYMQAWWFQQEGDSSAPADEAYSQEVVEMEDIVFRQTHCDGSWKGEFQEPDMPEDCSSVVPLVTASECSDVSSQDLLEIDDLQQSDGVLYTQEPHYDDDSPDFEALILEDKDVEDDLVQQSLPPKDEFSNWSINSAGPRCPDSKVMLKNTSSCMTVFNLIVLTNKATDWITEPFDATHGPRLPRMFGGRSINDRLDDFALEVVEAGRVWMVSRRVPSARRYRVSFDETILESLRAKHVDQKDKDYYWLLFSCASHCTENCLYGACTHIAVVRRKLEAEGRAFGALFKNTSVEAAAVKSDMPLCASSVPLSVSVPSLKPKRSFRCSKCGRNGHRAPQCTK